MLPNHNETTHRDTPISGKEYREQGHSDNRFSPVVPSVRQAHQDHLPAIKNYRSVTGAIGAAIVLLLSFQVSFSQSPKLSNDSTIDLMQRLPAEKRLDIIQKNLLRFSDHYTSGTVMVIGGIAFSAASAFIGASMKQTDPATGQDTYPKGAIYGIYFGGAAALIGSIVLMDSHKYIRRAGGYKKPKPQ